MNDCVAEGAILAVAGATAMLASVGTTAGAAALDPPQPENASAKAAFRVTTKRRAGNFAVVPTATVYIRKQTVAEI